MKPHPPSSLSKEFTRVWVGWCAIGDREVAREAAAKGIYISLALQFIATRTEWDHSDVERWFKSEILTWVYQLLDQRQIFKASHILSNIGLDPPEQLSCILLETTNKPLRDYIAEHLVKTSKLESSVLNTWNFIKAIEHSSSISVHISEEIVHTSIQKIDQKSGEWKSNVATVLFFNNYDFCLETFLTAEAAWKYLLAKEKCAILQLWIHVYFAKDYDSQLNLSEDVIRKLKNLFLLWPITSHMINGIKSVSTYSKFIANFVLNELAVFGIFTDSEKTDVSVILSRFSRTQNIQNIHTILQEPTSCLNISEFYEKLNYFCVTHELYELLSSFAVNIKFPNSLMHSKQLSLWLTKPDTTQGATNTEVLLKNIVTALHYFADDNIVHYLTRHPVILLTIITFTNEKLSDLLAHRNHLTFDSITLKSETIFDCFKDLPLLQTVTTKFLTHTNTGTVTLGELFGEHFSLNELFRDPGDVPHFNSARLCATHGYVDCVNYLYYIKQNRPAKAAKIFSLDTFRKTGNLTDADKRDALENVTKLVVTNCDKSNIVSACISFAEIIGISTRNVRVLITVFNEIKRTNYDLTQLCTMFASISQTATEILDIYEDILLGRCELDKNMDTNKFDMILCNYQVALQFATSNNLEWPTKFLLYCAKHNLYLAFTIFVQFFQYPLEQVLRVAVQFQNKDMADHMTHALASDLSSECDDLGSSVNPLTRSISSQISIELDNAGSTGAICEFPLQSDLLRVLIKCHKSGDPPTALLQACQLYKNPLLAILATCYEPDSVVINWLAWLSISAEIKVDLIENYAVPAGTVTRLLVDVLRKGYARTLLDSFKIFLPDNPLHSLAEFLNNCVLLNFDTSAKHLALFEKQLRHLNYNSVIVPNDFEYTFLTNSYWLLDTALKLIFTTLGHCFLAKSHQVSFLNVLCTAELTRNVPIQCPNFCSIAQLVENLSNCDLDLRLALFFNVDDRKGEVIRCIELLVAGNQYEQALVLAKFENLCVDYVLTEEWTYKFNHHLDEHFWTDCERAFIAEQMTPSSAAEFYICCCKLPLDCGQRHLALRLAYEWLKKSDYSDQFVGGIEREMWTMYFDLDDVTLHGSQYKKHETNYLLSEVQQRSTSSSSRLETGVLVGEQLRHLEETVGRILASGDVIEAVRLAKMFDWKCTEIEILLTCYELAEGKLRPYDISAEQRLLFLNRDRNLKSLAHRRRTVKSRLSNLSTGSYESTQTMVPIAEQDEPSSQDTLALLETMTERLHHGNNIGSRILMCYRIALNVDMPYQDIVKHPDSKQLLRQALLDNCQSKLDVVHDVFVIFKWTTTEITEFIFDELKAAISASIEHNLENISMWDLDLDAAFHLILQLCQENSSILGARLLTLTNTIQLTETSSSNVLIELLIRAHDCFNSQCNMEGIAAVLRKCQTLTAILLNRKEWRAMVRLLTGIARYTEMNYIFQILQENEQFEYLLRRNFRKDHGLKLALLTFLKRHCPKNQDLYRIVALHFSLYSEVAELWESEAVEMTRNLIEIAKLEAQNAGRNFELQLVLFTPSASTLLCLQKVMTDYGHAAEYHVHGDRLKRAMKAAQRAELVALQLGLLRAAPQNAAASCLLHLAPQQVMCLVGGELSFPQARILIDAYDYPVDWGAIIYKQCVQNAKLHYLDEFLTVKPLTNTLAQDLTRRFLADSVHTQVSVRAMKDLVQRLGSVHMRYRLASELGFSDVIETLLTGAQLAYLKDTVWKRGYKQL